MKRLLNNDEKRSVRTELKDNPVFNAINTAYKDKEIEMKTLHFSPEEIFISCFKCFDDILCRPDDVQSITSSLWKDINCELRYDAEDTSRHFEEEELEIATSCVAYSVLACIMATDEYKLIQYAESIMMQIAEYSELDDICEPLDSSLNNRFIDYILKYKAKGRYYSKIFEQPNMSDPINTKLLPKDRLNVKQGVKKRLAFMEGTLKNFETKIMSQPDYTKMIEAVEYLIENNAVKKQSEKISTYLPIAHLRYTFYLVYKNEANCISRELWLDFLGETFTQMQDNKKSLGNHFSDKPLDYNYSTT